jgi:hypothetical protein
MKPYMVTNPVTPECAAWIEERHDPAFVPGRRRYRRDQKGRFTK